MDVRTILQGQIRTQRGIADAVLGGLTQEMSDRTPPGQTNTIGTILLHVAGTDDFFLARASGGQRVWESGDWSARIGLPNPPGRMGFWEEANATSLPLGPVLEYGAAMRATLDAFVAGASEDDLANRLLPTPFGEQPLANVVGLLVVHAAGHFGEIAALKGAQGAKGLPF